MKNSKNFPFPTKEEEDEQLEMLAMAIDDPSLVLLITSLSESVIYAHTCLLVLENMVFNPEREVESEGCQLLEYVFEGETWLIAILYREHLKLAKALARELCLEIVSNNEDFSSPLSGSNVVYLIPDLNNPIYSNDEEIIKMAEEGEADLVNFLMLDDQNRFNN